MRVNGQKEQEDSFSSSTSTLEGKPSKGWRRMSQHCPSVSPWNDLGACYGASGHGSWLKARPCLVWSGPFERYTRLPLSGGARLERAKFSGTIEWQEHWDVTFLSGMFGDVSLTGLQRLDSFASN